MGERLNAIGVFFIGGYETSTGGQRLVGLAEREAVRLQRIRRAYAELDEEVYKLFGIPHSTRAVIEETLVERPPEIFWPQM